MSVRGISNSPRAFPDRVSYPRNRTRGGLVRGTARTTRARPCRPGTVANATTAATRHLARHSRSFCRHSARLALTLPRVTRLIPHTIPFALTRGDTECSHMATDISRVYSDLTHTVFLTHGRSLTRASYTHTPHHSHPRGHSPAVSHSHTVPRTPACHDAHTALDLINIHLHIGRHSRMFAHGD